MLRLISSRPLHLLLRRASPLHQLRSLATEILPIPHEIEEVSPAHHELLEVLSHRSSQLSSSKVPEKVEERKAKKIDDPSFPPPNRLAELSAQLHLNFDPEHELLEEAEEEPSSTLIPDEPVLAPSLEDLTWTEDDKTLNDLLSSLHSTKVRRIHKYTDEQLSLMHKHHEFNRMLQSYVDVSIHNGQLGKVRRLLDELLVDQERRQSMKHLTWRYVSNVNIYNSFFFAYAERGNLPALQKLFEKMRHHQIKPNLDSFAAALSCLGHMDLFDPKVARRIILDIEKEGYRVVDLFNLECLNDNHVHRICKVLRTFRPDFDIPMRSTEVKNPLLTKIYQTKIKDRSELYEEKDPWWKKIDQTKILDDQLAMEMEQKVIVKSIEKVSQVDPKLKERYEDLQNSVTQQLTVGFLTELEVLKKSAKNDLNLNIIPFLEIFETKDYVDFMSKELNRHFYASDFYSTPYHTLCVTLGKRLYQKYLCTVRQKSGFIEKLRTIYDDYLKYALTNERFLRTEREKWNEIVQEKSAYMDRSDRPWTYTQVLQIGEFLYNVMLKHLKLRVPLLTKQREKTGTKSNADAILYTVYRTSTHFSEKQIKVHPNVSHFFSHIPQVDLEFDSTELPCLTPPLPWLSPAVGGYLLNQTDFVRLPVSANEQETRLRSSPVEKIGGLLDSINVLNSCAWKINEDVLDLLIEVFQKGGSRQLSVPVSVANAQIDEPLPLEKGLTMDERKRRENALALARKLKAEVYSLWCNELYRLSIANHFRKRIFWFPHNMDFRGRVYPVPPHFNHLGSDVARSIILFADGKPLGPHGLRRLKIHLVNLTDLKKKASIDERARYADEILDEILDSADRPLTGRRWWAKSEEPWQTLACCMEIARAIRSGDPENYISHFPVHQDGSCNVLQHYAAMGLDDVGAASVNLKPSALPQDVYSVVVDQVEHERRQDAEKGLKIAQILQGFVKRKVIKQTIMTTNYGVTMYGARQQISRQLRDLDDFPKEYVPEASNYLAQKTFLSLRELFRETRKIQDWFTDCAGLISRIRGTVVEWNTPMNLPVIQPYYREVRTRQQGKNIYDNFSSFGRPNNIKQRNAFPPNYVHSLDSTHMMMTALQCARHGLTFVSVHDSFWTHACDVDQLNRFTREQFVALHNQPLLEILSRDFLAKYEFKASELARAKDHERQTMKLLNETLRRVPQRGSFRLESVLDSTYFFS